MVLAALPKHPTTPHARKRLGEHHQQHTKHYRKTYWPYLTMLAVVACSVLANALWTPGRQVLGYASDLSSASLLQRTNEVRLAEKEHTLLSNSLLDAAAQAKAADMVRHNYWSHVASDGRQPWSFAQAAGYGYTAIGENLAYGFDGSDAVVNAWLHSPEHRGNVLGNDYKEVGFGIASSPNFQRHGRATIVVALYGTTEPLPAAPAASGNVLHAASVNVSRLETLGSVSAVNAGLLAVLAAFGGAAATLLVVIRHGIILRRSLIKGEMFIVRYHLLDLILLGIGGVGFVITRSAGIIH